MPPERTFLAEQTLAVAVPFAALDPTWAVEPSFAAVEPSFAVADQSAKFGMKNQLDFIKTNK